MPRTQLIWIVLLSLFLCELSATNTHAAQASERRTNVLFIVVDDLNNALGTYGDYPTAKTPRIDALARQGMQFNRAYSQDPVCNPSRTSFLSGKRPATTGVFGNFVGPRHKLGDAVMLPEYFHKQGYFTARVGKVAHGRYESAVSWDIAENAKRRKHYLPGTDHSTARDNTWALSTADQGLSRAQVLGIVGRKAGLQLTWRATDEREDETPDGKTTRRVIELLREHRHKTFFIGCGFHKPHQPWVAPKSYFHQHPIDKVQLPHEPANDRDDIPKPALTGYPEDADHTDAQKRQAIAAYHATITLIDDQVGLLLDTLNELGLDDSTLVVFVSDHGFHLGEHGGLWCKHTQFEESTRVPLIVRGPGIPAGTTCDALVELVDLYPTLAEYCGLAEPHGMEGTSFASLFRNLDLPWKSAIYSGALHGKYYGSSIRTAHYRYTEWSAVKGDATTEYELYDVRNDPREYTNLAHDPMYGPTREELASQLKAGWQSAVPKVAER